MARRDEIVEGPFPDRQPVRERIGICQLTRQRELIRAHRNRRDESRTRNPAALLLFAVLARLVWLRDGDTSGLRRVLVRPNRFGLAWQHSALRALNAALDVDDRQARRLRHRQLTIVGGDECRARRDARCRNVKQVQTARQERRRVQP